MIYRLGDFHFPDDPARLYPHTPQRPWVLEIGFGDGRFWPEYVRGLAERGQDAPNYLGVEISGVSLLKAARRLRQDSIENAHLSKLMATPMLREVVPAHSLSAIVVNFPDPWPKAEHLSHRLLRTEFFELAASRLHLGGAVLLTTDHDEYFEFACQQAQQSGAVTVEPGDPPAAALHTKYAMKWQNLGLRAQHARFVVKDAPNFSPSGFSPYPLQENAVPHAILTLPPTFDFGRFDKQTVRGAAHTVVLLDAYRSLRRDEYTVLAHVVEGELTQEVLVNVTQRQDGTTLVRLGKFGGPIVTPGVKAAVGAVSDFLRQHGAQLQHHGY